MQRPIGVQSFCYHQCSLDELCDDLADTAVSAIELCEVHLEPSADETTIQSTLDELDRAGLSVTGFGVNPFEDADEVPAVLDFVDRLGASYVSVDFDPDDDELRQRLAAEAAERNLDVAIHNHGPEATYATVDDVRSVFEGQPENLGACVDTGHFARAGETPAEVLPKLTGRVHALHLTDIDGDGEEVLPGDGMLDFDELENLLADAGFDRPVVIEYEADPSNPGPAIRETIDRLRD
jgi:sugar phosphate isomerase/epimerase